MEVHLVFKQSFKDGLQSNKSLIHWWSDVHFGKDGPSACPNVEETSPSPLAPSQGLHSGYSRAFGHPLLWPHTPRLCPPGPRAGARARCSLPFKGYFSTWHLPIAGKSNKFPLSSVFTVLPSILIPGRSILLQSQRADHTPFISTQPQSYVCPQEEMFPMQGMTQTRSKQRYKESGEKWTVTAVYKRWRLS